MLNAQKSVILQYLIIKNVYLTRYRFFYAFYSRSLMLFVQHETSFATETLFNVATLSVLRFFFLPLTRQQN